MSISLTNQSTILSSAGASRRLSRRVPQCVGPYRNAPINSLAQHRQLCWGENRRSFLRQRPDEPSTLEPFRIETQPGPVPPQHLDPIGTFAAEYEEMSAVRVLLQHVLHHHGEAIEAAPHVGRPAGHPDLRPCRKRNHRQPSRASAKRAALAGATRSHKRRTRPLRSTTSITGASLAPLGMAAFKSAPARTVTGAKRTAAGDAPDNPPTRACRRHAWIRLAWISRCRANSATLSPEVSQSFTIRSFSALVQRRRRSGPANTETVVMCAP